jgi:protein subunit release factor A
MNEDVCVVDIGAVLGGPESHQFVEILLAMFLAWAKRENVEAEVLERSPAFGGGLKSAKLELSTDRLDYLAALHHGAHTLVRTPPDDLNRRRHMSVAGIRVSSRVDLPLPETLAGWGDERRRYILHPAKAVNDAKLGRLEIDPLIVFDGGFSAIEG